MHLGGSRVEATLRGVVELPGIVGALGSLLGISSVAGEFIYTLHPDLNPTSHDRSVHIRISFSNLCQLPATVMVPPNRSKDRHCNQTSQHVYRGKQNKANITELVSYGRQDPLSTNPSFVLLYSSLYANLIIRTQHEQPSRTISVQVVKDGGWGGA